jgi:hypothetical protein
MSDAEASRRLLTGSRLPSLAQTLHQYGERGKIEQVERGTQWVAVPGPTPAGVRLDWTCCS